MAIALAALTACEKQWSDYTPMEPATQEAIEAFQRKNLLEPNRAVTSEVFNRLATEYERINSYNQ